MKNRKPKLKIEIACDVEPDGSLGQAYITSSAGHRSGYCLRDPFAVLVDVDGLIQKNFMKTEDRRKL